MAEKDSATDEYVTPTIVSTELPDSLCVDDFEWGRNIGEGAFSNVYIARHAASGSNYPYAIKVVRKSEVVARNQVQHIIQERKVALTLKIQHAFLNPCVGAFHDERNIYFVMEFVSGGDLFAHLRRSVRFKKRTAAFYTAQVIIAFEYLHSKGVAYRDLKPENILLDRRGYMRLTDFGLAKHIPDGDRTYTVCGTPEYCAPEVIRSTGHGVGVDWWTVGVLLYELLVGQPPFVAQSLMEVYKLILRCAPRFPAKSFRIVGPNAKHLIKKLIVADESHRYGITFGKSQKIKDHKFFKGMRWADLLNRKLGSMEGAIVPAVANAEDTSQFPEKIDDSSSSKTEGGPGSKEPEGSAKGADDDAEEAAGEVVETFVQALQKEPLPVLPDPEVFDVFD